MSTKQRRLALWMHILSLDSKPTEFLTSLITIGIGLGIVQGDSPIITTTNALLRFMVPYMGWVLIYGALLQIAGVVITVCGFFILGRILRWLSSVLDGSIWTALVVFLFNTTPITDSLYVIYLSLLINDAWIVMGIAYRGYRGRGTH